MDKGKKLISLFLCCFSLVLLAGCWNYRGLNEMTIVSGIAVDRNPENGNFHLTFETIDMSIPVKEKGLTPRIIEAEGKTLFDAARGAKRRNDDKLYFGNTQVIIVSELIAKEDGLHSVIDWFMRDGEGRETLTFAISQEKNARDILSAEGVSTIAGYEIYRIISADQKVTSTANHTELYQIYNTLHSNGQDLTLPALHNTNNDNKPTPELNGVAVFKGDKLAGYLSTEESKYFLFATDEVKGGVLTLSSTNEVRNDVSLEIDRNKTKRSFSYEDGKLKIVLNIKTHVFLNEITSESDALDQKQTTAFADKASKMLENNIKATILKIQTEYRTDILGFGALIHQKNYKLWKELSDEWDNLFPTLAVEVHAKVLISNTAYLKKS